MKFHNQSLKPRRKVANTRSSAVLPEGFGKDFMIGPAKSVLDGLGGVCDPASTWLSPESLFLSLGSSVTYASFTLVGAVLAAAILENCYKQNKLKLNSLCGQISSWLESPLAECLWIPFDQVAPSSLETWMLSLWMPGWIITASYWSHFALWGACWEKM